MNEDTSSRSDGRLLLVDSHLDLAWNALQWNRDLTRSVHTIRTLEASLSEKGRGEGTVALPELRRGGVGVAFATTLARCTGHALAGVDYLHPAQAYGAAQGHLAYYQGLEALGIVRLLRDPQTLETHLTECRRWLEDGAPAPPLGLAPCMESADPILHPAQLEAWVRQGIWMVGPAHYGLGRYAGGTGSDQGLTSLGVELLAEMDRQGVTLDITHLSDRALEEAMGAFEGPLVASHHNCRALVPHQRQLDDAQLRSLFAREAVIGIALDAWMLVPRWVKGVTSNKAVGLSTVVDHIDHACQLAGNARHVGIGSDLDGGFGLAQSPRDIDTIADIQRVAALLSARNYSDNEVQAIFHGNWLRVLKAGLVGICERAGSYRSGSGVEMPSLTP